VPALKSVVTSALDRSGEAAADLDGSVARGRGDSRRARRDVMRETQEFEAMSDALRRAVTPNE